MRRIVAMVLILAAFALCAATSEVGLIGNELRNGSYIFRIPTDEENPNAWEATVVTGDNVVQLVEKGIRDGAFEARFDPLSDGEATVAARHSDGIVCDRALSWGLTVVEGEVKDIVFIADITGPIVDVTGEWREADTQFTTLIFSANPEKGWDVEITSPLTHGAYIFRATANYDCALNAFVYDNGAFYDVPIGEASELGAPVSVGTAGNLAFNSAGRLVWRDSQRVDETVAFEKTEE